MIALTIICFIAGILLFLLALFLWFVGAQEIMTSYAPLSTGQKLLILLKPFLVTNIAALCFSTCIYLMKIM